MYQRRKLGLIYGGIVVAVCVVAGCSGEVSKRQIANAINERFKQKTCFALQDKKPPTWPIRVQRPESMGKEPVTPLNPILSAMQAAGYLQITQERPQQNLRFGGPLQFGPPPIVDVIAPTEKAKGWWDVREGFCVGTEEVADVQEWTEPAKESGAPIQASFTWHLTNVPSWAQRSEFKDVPGMTTPVPTMAVLQKTSNGWKVVG